MARPLQGYLPCAACRVVIVMVAVVVVLLVIVIVGANSVVAAMSVQIGSRTYRSNT